MKWNELGGVLTRKGNGQRTHNCTGACRHQFNEAQNDCMAVSSSNNPKKVGLRKGMTEFHSRAQQHKHHPSDIPAEAG